MREDKKQKNNENEIPNEETLKAFAETDEKLKSEKIERFSGSTEDFLKKVLKEDSGENSDANNLKD